MAGVLLPGGRTLVGSHVEPPPPPDPSFCGDPPTVGLTLPGGRTLVGRSVCEGPDPLLAGAVLYIDAARNDGDGTNEGTAGSALDASGTFVRYGPDSYTGEAFMGAMTLDGGYDDAGDWFTDLDITAVVACPRHHENAAGEWAELFHIAVTGGAGVTEWLELALIFRDGGDVAIGLDFESGSETGGPTVTSDKGLNDTEDSDPDGVLFDWQTEDLAETTLRVTAVAATGEFTFYADDVVMTTWTVGAVAFPEPPAAEVVQVGPFQYAPAIKSVTLLDGIDGDPILEWDAEDTTGWTPTTGGYYLGEAPDDPFWFAGDGEAIVISDDDALDIGASADATIALWFTTPYLADTNNEIYAYATRATGTLGNNGDGFVIRDLKFDGLSLDGFAVTMGDGTANAANQRTALSNTGWAAGRHLVVVTVDRAAGTLKIYRDGTEHASQTLSSLGAVDPAADLRLEKCVVHAVAKWDDVIDPADIAAERP